MALPPDVASLLAAFADAVGDALDDGHGDSVGLVALYVGGSLNTGDFQPGISDLDVAAIISTPLSADQKRRLRTAHQRLMHQQSLADKLHCVYVPLTEVADPAATHPYWALGEFHRHALTGVARAELLTRGFTVHGPSPGALLPTVSPSELTDSVRGELSGYWRGAIRKPWLWLDDGCVDLGLVTLARVEATLIEGRLITKREAITRLGRVGVPAGLAHEVAQRRRGEPVAIGGWARALRACRARRVMASGIRRLLAR